MFFALKIINKFIELYFGQHLQSPIGEMNDNKMEYIKMNVLIHTRVNKSKYVNGKLVHSHGI